MEYLLPQLHKKVLSVAKSKAERGLVRAIVL
jgi:hypothetical protein